MQIFITMHKINKFILHQVYLSSQIALTVTVQNIGFLVPDSCRGNDNSISQDTIENDKNVLVSVLFRQLDN